MMMGKRQIRQSNGSNVLLHTNAGQFGYDPLLPYGISGLMSPAPSVPMREQYLHYNAMQQPDTIIENGYTATFSYYGDKSHAASRWLPWNELPSLDWCAADARLIEAFSF